MGRALDRIAVAAALRPDRARAWCLGLLAVSLPWAVFVLAREHGWGAAPVGTDFVSFWVAGREAMSGGVAAVYDPDRHAAAEHLLFAGLGPSQSYAFFYPPTFLLLCLPLAALPYPAAFVAFLLAGFAPLLLALRRLLPFAWATLPILADPAMLLNALHGQNAFLTGAALAGGTVLLDRRPVLAGAAWGLLAIKPQLAIGVPVALLFARRWRAAAGAAGSAAALMLLAALVLGPAAWSGFRAVSAVAREALLRGEVDPWKMVSVFAAARVLHAPAALATLAQALAAGVALLFLARLAARRPSGPVLGGAAVLATLLATPFVLDYDLVALAVPLAVLAADAQRTGWRRWEKSAGALAWALPFFARDLAGIAHLPVAPVAIAALDAVFLRRALSRSAR